MPEMIGLAITPAAIIASLVLLGSSHPWRNVALLSGSFLAVYAVLSVIVWSLGNERTPSDGSSLVRGWIGIGLGVLFLLGGALTWRRGARSGRTGSDPETPAWVQRLDDPPWRMVLGVGVVLSVLNPNVAILTSGLGIILTAGAAEHAQLLGIGLLLASSMLDFAVPTLAFSLAGDAGRRRLRAMTGWLVQHNRPIGVGVLVFFGLLFLGRGLAVVAR